MYQSELCDAKRRGRLVSSEPLFVGVGIVISYYFDYGMSFVGGPVAWRVPIACQCFFAFIVIFLVFGLPESPRWLYAHGRNEEALQVLCDVWDTGPEGDKVSGMHSEILEALRLEKKSGEYRWSQLFKRDEVQTGRRVLLAWGMQFMNQVIYCDVLDLRPHTDTLYRSAASISWCKNKNGPHHFVWHSDLAQVLRSLSAPVQRGPHPESVPPDRWSSTMLFFLGIIGADLFPGPPRATSADDVGIL